jgi:hypothetical protein
MKDRISLLNPTRGFKVPVKKLRCQPSAVVGSPLRQRGHAVGVVTAGVSLFGACKAPNGIAAEKAGY